MQPKWNLFHVKHIADASKKPLEGILEAIYKCITEIYKWR